MRLPVATNNIVRRLRDSRGISQDELAEALGVSQAEISQLENGKRNLSIEKWLTMSDYFCVPVQDIYGWKRKTFSRK
jgi:DNA-binding XRE family transcriptional regulator